MKILFLNFQNDFILKLKTTVMKKLLITTLSFLLMNGMLMAQTNTFPTTGSAGIGTTSPNASALLDIQSTTQGLLIPRMTSAQREAIVTPATGLLVYQINGIKGLYYFKGSRWSNISGGKTNSELSNLSATTAINASLIPGKNDTINFGSPTKAWKNGFFSRNITADSVGTFYNLVVKDTGMFTGRVGIAGPTSADYALTLNSTYNSLGGILVTEPYSSYGFNCEKSGAFEVVIARKNSMNSSTPCIGGYNTGNGGGVQGNSNTGIGVRGESTTNYGIYGITGNASTFAGYFSGDVYSTGTFQTSDARLKKNIKPLENGMDIINRLEPKTYQFKNEGAYEGLHLPAGNHFGLLAQDVEKIIPEMVKDANVNSSLLKTTPPVEGEKGTEIAFKAVNYNELIPVLIKALQEQDTKIKALTELVQSLAPSARATVETIQLTNASLEQNIPNPPTNNTTRINYSIPNNAGKAEMVITDINGKMVKQIALNNKGKGILNVDTKGLASGAYTYTMYVDGKMVDTKKMMVAK